MSSLQQQMLDMKEQYGFEAMFRMFLDLANNTTNITPVSNDTNETTPIAKKIKKTKKMEKQERKEKRLAQGQELATKIKSTHNIDVVPTDYTLKSLRKMLKTGQVQSKRKMESNWMRFLANEHIENAILVDNKLASREVTKKAGRKWREMNDEQKNKWKKVTTEQKVEQVDTNEKPVEKVDTNEKPDKPPGKMLKTELINYLGCTHFWAKSLLKKYKVDELRQAAKTGTLPTLCVKPKTTTKKTTKKTTNKKTTKKTTKKAQKKTQIKEDKKEEEVVQPEVEVQSEESITDIFDDNNMLGMFDMSDDDDSDE
jgi:hypothetical protein